MIKITFTLVVLLVLSGFVFGQANPEPILQYSAMPNYPPLARLANIQGDVKIDFTLNSSGNVVSTTVVSGHPILKAAAEENVKTWKFQLPQDLFRTSWDYSTVFHFKISDDKQPYQAPNVTVTRYSYRYVEIVAPPPSSSYAHDCPTPNEVQPPTSIQSGDFVELSRSQCYGTCPSYKVRVSENGDVTWKGEAFVAVTRERRATIDSEAARDLLREFLSREFWSFCGGYDSSITDSASSQIEVRIGGQSKKVWNYADSAPDLERRLELDIDAVTNSHAWRHGDPRSEPLSNIFEDAYMPKPGVTALMRTVTGKNTEKIKSLLASNNAVDETDSSGWTPLMYAAASSDSEAVPILLAAGANANHRSFSGDTPLMSAAISGSFDDDLVHAGANLNAQNSAGTTALMILAAKGESDELSDALNAGADPTLKDAKGRTALDYLRLANCGRSPVPDWNSFGSGGKCDYLDEDDVRKITALLKHASAARSRKGHAKPARTQ